MLLYYTWAWSFFDAWWRGERQQGKNIFNIRENPDRTKDDIFTHIKNEWESDAVNIVKEGNFGTHSNRKRAYTKMRCSGILHDWADIRGRWKSRKTAIDRYQDTLLPYPDAKAMAAALCDRGPIKYVIRDGFAITDNWLDEHVTCNMQRIEPLICKSLYFVIIFKLHLTFQSYTKTDKFVESWEKVYYGPVSNPPWKIEF